MEQIEVVEIAPGRFAMTGMGQYQSHDPEFEGFVPMNQQRAEEVAEAMRLRLAQDL
jgi:hypothetical protein